MSFSLIPLEILLTFSTLLVKNPSQFSLILDSPAEYSESHEPSELFLLSLLISAQNVLPRTKKQYNPVKLKVWTLPSIKTPIDISQYTIKSSNIKDYPQHFLLNKTLMRIDVLGNKIDNDKMINGVSLSEIEGINLTQISHYRRISQIQNGNYSRISQLNPDLLKIVHNRKNNHEKWKRFQQARFTTEIERGNVSYRSKLEKIKLGRSRYSINRDNSPTQTKPNNFYTRKRYQQLIESSNPSIGRKLVNVKGSFDHNKTSAEYSKYRDTVRRLQRFSVFQRMTSFSQKRSKIKTQGDKSIYNIISPSPSTEKKRSFLQTPKKFISKQ